jgi:hypothetical protein
MTAVIPKGGWLRRPGRYGSPARRSSASASFTSSMGRCGRRRGLRDPAALPARGRRVAGSRAARWSFRAGARELLFTHGEHCGRSQRNGLVHRSGWPGTRAQLLPRSRLPSVSRLPRGIARARRAPLSGVPFRDIVTCLRGPRATRRAAYLSVTRQSLCSEDIRWGRIHLAEGGGKNGTGLEKPTLVANCISTENGRFPPS